MATGLLAQLGELAGQVVFVGVLLLLGDELVDAGGGRDGLQPAGAVAVVVAVAALGVDAGAADLRAVVALDEAAVGVVGGAVHVDAAAQGGREAVGLPVVVVRGGDRFRTEAARGG